MWEKSNSGIFTDITFIKKVNRTPLNDVFDGRHRKCVCVGGGFKKGQFEVNELVFYYLVEIEVIDFAKLFILLFFSS